MRKAFTLIEVTLAMLIMSGGILSIVGLYSFGFRENGQSREDVASAALADAVISPLVMAISATNLQWNSFRNEFYYPDEDGWWAYCDSNGQVVSDPESKAESVFSGVMSKMSGAAKGALNVDTAFPSTARASTGLSAGLIVRHDKDSAVVKISFRAVPKGNYGQLLAMPLYYTEVRFQGLQE